MSLAKLLAVAEAEFRAMTRSKAFIISIVVLPILILGLSFMQKQISERADTSTKKFAVIDPSGRFFDALADAAKKRDTAMAAAPQKVRKPPFAPERVDLGGRSLDDVRVQLSERVRKEELFAFVEIPADPATEKLRYYSDHPAYDDLREWIAKALDEKMRDDRYAEAHLDPKLVEALGHKVSADTLGLWTRDADGKVHPAEKQDEVRAIVIPMAAVFLLFFFVVSSAPQLMNSVLTEKTSRISEVLLGSLTPTELMTGKLLGSVAVSLLLGAIYLTAGLSVAARMGFAGAVPPALVAWFLVFLVLAMLLYGSMSMAIGAACNDVKDAQNLMLPMMLPLMIPMMVLLPVIQSPSSPLAVGMSLFPLATPLVMLLRVALHPTAPWWQVALGAALTLSTAMFCIWSAGKIFRVGLLAQGKSASLAQIARWISLADSRTCGDTDACRALPQFVRDLLHGAPGKSLPRDATQSAQPFVCCAESARIGVLLVFPSRTRETRSRRVSDSTNTNASRICTRCHTRAAIHRFRATGAHCKRRWNRLSDVE